MNSCCLEVGTSAQLPLVSAQSLIQATSRITQSPGTIKVNTGTVKTQHTVSTSRTRIQEIIDDELAKWLPHTEAAVDIIGRDKPIRIATNKANKQASKLPHARTREALEKVDSGFLDNFATFQGELGDINPSLRRKACGKHSAGELFIFHTLCYFYHSSISL